MNKFGKLKEIVPQINTLFFLCQHAEGRTSGLGNDCISALGSCLKCFGRLADNQTVCYLQDTQKQNCSHQFFKYSSIVCGVFFYTVRSVQHRVISGNSVKERYGSFLDMVIQSRTYASPSVPRIPSTGHQALCKAAAPRCRWDGSFWGGTRQDILLHTHQAT